MLAMQTSAIALAGFAFPSRPARAAARPSAPARPILPPLQEASLVGIVSLLAAWGIAEVALLLQGF
jgi:hypothetical protein